MSRPEVTLENYPAVFEYYDQRRPNPNFARLGHYVMTKLYHPHITMAEHDQAELQRELSGSAQMLLVSNHTTSKEDQYNLAASVYLAPPLRPRMGYIAIMSKMSVFNGRGIGGKLQRYAVDGLGAIPVVRGKDINPNDYATQEELEEAIAEQRQNSKLSRQLGINKTLRDHLDLAGFPEGERLLSGQDPRTVRELKTGFSDIYSHLVKVTRVVVVSVGLFNGDGEDFPLNGKEPDMVFGKPLVTDTRDLDEFNELMRGNMQRDLTAAVEQRARREKQLAGR